MYTFRTEIGFLELKENCQRDAKALIRHPRPLDATVLLRNAPVALLRVQLPLSDPLSSTELE